MHYFPRQRAAGLLPGGFDGPGEGVLLVHGSISRSAGPGFSWNACSAWRRTLRQQHLADQKLPLCRSARATPCCWPCAAGSSRPLPACAATQHPGTHLLNQPHVFQHRNELHWRHQAPHRVLPTQQGFDTHNAVATQSHLRLVVQNELVALQRLAQVHRALPIQLDLSTMRRPSGSPSATKMRREKGVAFIAFNDSLPPPFDTPDLADCERRDISAPRHPPAPLPSKSAIAACRHPDPPAPRFQTLPTSARRRAAE
jgi:hypothetical protein